jgi:hypothetical protein
MHSDYEESGGIHKSENAPNSPETGSVNPEDSSKEVHAKFMKDNLGPFEGEVTINEAKAQERESSILEAGFTGIPSEFDDGIHPYFSLNKAEETFSQTSHLSNSTRAQAGSVQILLIFFLGSFSICSASLNLYLFWQARNLGAEIERLKPPTKSGLAPRQ